MSESPSFQEIIGISLSEPSLLAQALVHSSYINENPSLFPNSNERLEFLGDAVLGLIIARQLFHKFPQATEGDMTRLRAALVKRETLAQIARSIRLGDYLYLGKGEETGGGREKPVNLAGAFEAVLAAIFLDQGMEKAEQFVLKLFQKDLNKLENEGTETDYKSQLQEIVQASQQCTPSYHVVEAVGPDHDKTFLIEVRMGDTVLGKGSGKSKKLAEVEAARSALERIPGIFTQ